MMTIQELRESFNYSYDSFSDSRKQADEIWEYYHDRQYTQAQKDALTNRGQPVETFNIIKMFSRMVIGYYSNVINNIRIKPRQYNDIVVSEVLNDLVQSIIYDNNFRYDADIVKLDAILSGLMSVYVNVQSGKDVDPFGRKIYDIGISYVPSRELLLDPMSHKSDYSDARYVHRFKWITKEEFTKLFGESKREKVDANTDFLNIDTSDESELYTEESFNVSYNGAFKVKENYLVVHTIENTENGWKETYWCGDTILDTDELDTNPYVIVKLSDSYKAEYYGMFREVLETQKSINQAVIKIQQLVNTNKVFVEEGAVRDLDSFTAAFERVNSVIPIEDLNGIKVENMSTDIVNQYQIIDSALNRIKQILGINDSFLGMAYASDSGRKVKLQQTATIVALRYITNKFEVFYRSLGEKLLQYIKTYYTAWRIVRISDDINGERWIELNRPLTDENGKPIMAIMGQDKDGSYLLDTMNDSDTDIKYADVDIIIETNSYNDEDERNQLILETFINGAVGQALMTVNPSGFFKIASLNVKNFKSKYSPEIARVLDETAQMTQPQPQMQDALGAAGQSMYSQSRQLGMNQEAKNSESPMSGQLKLPQNTNEGV